MIYNKIKKTIDSTPISLDTAKKQCEVEDDFTDDDALIQQKIDEAVSIVEDIAGRDVSKKTNTQKIYDGSFVSEIVIREPSFSELESISYIDSNDQTVTLTSSDYRLIEKETFTVIDLDDRISFKELNIQFESGYTDATLPKNVASAIYTKVCDLYDMERTSITIGTNYRDNETFKKALGGFIAIQF